MQRIKKMSNCLGLFQFSCKLCFHLNISKLLIKYFTVIFLFFRSSDIIVSINNDEEENDELSVSFLIRIHDLWYIL